MFSRRIDRLAKYLLVFLFVLLITACGGETSAPPAEGGCSYSLPYPSYLGSVQVSQGNSNPDNSHLPGEALEYAFDFDLNAGDPVLASRHGWVTEVHDGETACGGRGRINDANYVIVDHRDGTYASYLHLQAGIPVRGGQEVWPDKTVIGYVGNTGYTNCQTSAGGGYHLHFQVQDGSGVGDQSLPICFSDVPGNGIPVEGRAYQSQNQTVMVLGVQVTTVAEPSEGTPWYYELLGLWEGEVEEIVDGNWQTPRTLTVEITNDCPTSDICLLFPGSPEPGPYPHDQPGDYLFCFGDGYNYYCFGLNHPSDTLTYQGHGPLWAGSGELHRVSSQRNPSPRPALPLDTSDSNSVIEWLAYALRRGDISVFEKLTRDQTIGYGSGFAGGRFGIPRSEFLEMLEVRIVNGAVCRGYSGDNEYLMVWTSGWNPHWGNLDGTLWGTDELVLSFFNSGEGLSLLSTYSAPSAMILELPSVQSSPCPD